MSSDTTARLNGTKPANPGELKAEIARTREDLGETATALAAKADVKTRVKEKAAGQATALADGIRERVATAAGKIKDTDPAQAVRRPIPVAVIAALASAAALAVVLVRRNRR